MKPHQFKIGDVAKDSYTAGLSVIVLSDFMTRGF